MTSAAVLSLEEFRDAQRRTEVRQRLHDRFEHWLQPLEKQVNEPNPTLEELTQAVLALRQELTQAVTEGLVEHTHRTALEQRTVACPQCGQVLSARGP
jgi:DNA repair exonuclease SbcCD ATPase subunit